MTNTSKLMKGLLAATALTAFSAVSAHAQITPNNYTAAGTTVSNTFTLDYSVDGVPQDQIDSSDPTDPNGPTEFTVDRLVNLTVASDGDNTVAPGATDEELIFSVLNTGNDTQGYALSVVEETTAPDTFDTNDPASATAVIQYYVDDGDGVYEPGADDGAIQTYDPANPPQVAPDEMIWVVVTQDIGAATDGDQADVTLVADTLDAGTTNPTTADGDGNSLGGGAENVLADGSGTANEAANNGDHSATGSYVVASADIEALKTVSVFSEDGSNCATIPGTPSGGYGVPGACVEYVISVTNSGSEAATAVDAVDVLPGELEFVDAVFGGDFTGGTLSEPAAGTDCVSSACTVQYSGGTLPAPVAPATETVGTVTIRAIVK